jgi:hypothetical protein
MRNGKHAFAAASPIAPQCALRRERRQYESSLAAGEPPVSFHGSRGSVVLNTAPVTGQRKSPLATGRGYCRKSRWLTHRERRGLIDEPSIRDWTRYCRGAQFPREPDCG